MHRNQITGRSGDGVFVRLEYSDGRPVRHNDVLLDENSKGFFVDGGTPPWHPLSHGRVHLRRPGGSRRSISPRKFNLVWRQPI